MGCFPGFSGSCCTKDIPFLNKDTKTEPNPNPYKFTIKEYHGVGKYLLLLINYPDCITYNGDKLLLFEYKTIRDIEELQYCDPHFLDDNLNLIGRFRPNESGIELAKKIMRS